MSKLTNIYILYKVLYKTLRVSVKLITNLSGVPKGGGGGVGVFKTPRNSEGPPKSCQTQPRL